MLYFICGHFAFPALSSNCLGFFSTLSSGILVNCHCHCQQEANNQPRSQVTVIRVSLLVALGTVPTCLRSLLSRIIRLSIPMTAPRFSSSIAPDVLQYSSSSSSRKERRKRFPPGFLESSFLIITLTLPILTGMPGGCLFSSVPFIIFHISCSCSPSCTLQQYICTKTSTAPIDVSNTRDVYNEC